MLDHKNVPKGNTLNKLERWRSIGPRRGGGKTRGGGIQATTTTPDEEDVGKGETTTMRKV